MVLPIDLGIKQKFCLTDVALLREKPYLSGNLLDY
jgi:hypothetical protein